MSRPDLMPLAEEERADLLALLRELTPAQWDAPSLCSRWQVRDVAIHQDIRRALGLPRTIPEHRLVPVLTFSLAAPTRPSKGNAKGLRLVATDVDWTAGDGPEVTGPGEALLMAAAGRASALDDLTGDGLPTLRKRVERS